MGKKHSPIMIISVFLLLQSCNLPFLREDASEEVRVQQEQYQPHKLQHTIEGYREFIARYPTNMYVEEARQHIEDLEFAPHEQTNTVEGYMEFRLRYPHNWHYAEADRKIEQLECKRCEETGTVKGYQEFLLKYPESASAEQIKSKLKKIEGLEKPGPAEKESLLKEPTVPLGDMNGLKVMTMVSERDRGKDYIISSSWKCSKKDRVRHSMNYVEKRKFFGGKDGIRYKSVIRYIDPPSDYGNAILTWNYEDQEKAFWFIRFRSARRVAKRTTNTEFLRPSAEADFSLIDYYDINVGEEAHKLLRKEAYEDTTCFVVESTPIKQKLKYGKRISWIDPQHWIPLKIEYYDKKGELWKLLHVEWQNKFGLWFWKNAKITNVQGGYKTTIIIEDVRVNLGLPDRDFTKISLETKILGF